MVYLRPAKDTTRLRNLCNIVRLYTKARPDSAEFYIENSSHFLNEAISVAKEKRIIVFASIMLARIKYFEGFMYMNRGEFLKGEKPMELSMLLAQKFGEEMMYKGALLA